MSSYGTLFRVTTFGESHGAAVGCVIDGCAPGMILTAAEIQIQLDRRRSGQSQLTTSRKEYDKIEILSGVEPSSNLTLGSPICLIARNGDVHQFDYADTSLIPRPGHADYTYEKKYGIRSSSGGGRASARETLARVAAGMVAEKCFNFLLNRCVDGPDSPGITAWVSSVGSLSIPLEIEKRLILSPPSREEVDELGSFTENGEFFSTRCPDPTTARLISAEIMRVRNSGDSLGGVVTCVVTNIPAGLGEPCFDKLHAEIGKAMLSIPAVKGVEFGAGFEGARNMTGSQHNDCFTIFDKKSLRSETNNSGGVLGGISTGGHLEFKIAFKPVSSINKHQQTMDFHGNLNNLLVKGRHDPCVLPRCPPIVEAMTSIVLCDMLMRQLRFARPLATN